MACASSFSETMTTLPRVAHTALASGPQMLGMPRIVRPSTPTASRSSRQARFPSRIPGPRAREVLATSKSGEQRPASSCQPAESLRPPSGSQTGLRRRLSWPRLTPPLQGPEQLQILEVAGIECVAAMAQDLDFSGETANRVAVDLADPQNPAAG